MRLLLQAATVVVAVAVQRRNEGDPRESHHHSGSVSLKTKHGNGEVLPAVSPMLKGPRDTYQAIETKVANIEDMLASQERQALDEIRHRKAGFEKSLLSQREMNREVTKMNIEIEGKIKSTEDDIQAIRKHAAKMLKENQALSGTLETLAHNVSIAHEFAQESLSLSKRNLQVAPELQVLDELEAKEADSEHRTRLDNFAAGFAHQKLSMLHILDTLPEADELIARLGLHLSEASAEKNASLTKLTESFEQLWKEGESHHEELMTQQLQLNETLHSAEATHSKVIAAVEHLAATQKQLQERVSALKAFGQALGGEVNVEHHKAHVVAALRMAKKTAPAYHMEANGIDGCPVGREIKTQAECEEAVKALSLSTQPVWKRPHENIPKWCSYKHNGACEKSHCMHFNPSAGGKGRKDLAPICRSS